MHSFTSSWHCAPLYPSEQLHVKLPIVFTQEALFSHGLLEIHSLMSFSQSFPLNPALQLQVNPPIVFEHVALNLQGLFKHSSMSSEQLRPLNISVQLQ